MVDQYEPQKQTPKTDDEFEVTVDGEEHVPDGTAPLPDEDTERQLGDSEGVMAEQEPPKAPNKFKRFFQGYWRKKKWTVPLTIVVLVGIVFALPLTRYPLLALALKRTYKVEIVDSKSNTPVTGAQVSLDGQTGTTSNTGDVTITVPVGKRSMMVSKQYYQSSTSSVFVGLHAGNNITTVHLVATGRQVPIKVVNKLTGVPVPNAEVKVLDTEAKTDDHGMATIVLPTSAPTQTATIAASGYNGLSSSVTVTSSVVSSNTFALVPSGKVYFLSNLSGNIDVVSTNLDGSNRQTVVAGTGNEDPNSTSLLASRDWQYLALLAKRGSGQPEKLYLINTSNNQLTTIDGGGTENISLVGWSDHKFVYQVNDSSVQLWQNGRTVLKSYDVDNGKTNTIDQTSADGSQTSYESQTLAFVDLVTDKVVYGMSWSANYGGMINSSKQNAILSADTDGSNKVTLKSITLPANSWTSGMSAVSSKPGSLDVQSYVGSGQSIYYSYNYGNNTVTQSNTISDTTYSQEEQSQVTYLESPSGNQTFWAEQRDGKYSLFVGDQDGNNSNQIATLSDYTTYGWYTDNYVLVEKGGSELYIMPTNGGQAFKISDYYKPPINYYGYGGGYGG
jgi:hypothetical protein